MLLTAFLIKLCIVYYNQDTINVWEDDVIARNMLETGEMYYMQRDTPNHMSEFPVYVSLVFLTYKIFGSIPFYAIIMNLFIISITCFLLFDIFCDIFTLLNLKLEGIKPEFIALVSIFAFLLHPFITYYSMFKVHSLVSDIFFPVLIIFLSQKFILKPNLTFHSLLAFGTGFGLLNRPTSVVALFPFFILGIKFFGLKKTMQKLVFVFSISALIIIPWLLRGYRIHGVASMAPMRHELLWKGSLYNSDGSNYLLNGEPYFTNLSNDENDYLYGKSIEVQNEFFKNKFNQLLVNDPLHIVKMYIIKLKNFWFYHKNLGIEYSEKINSYLILYKVYVYFLIILNLTALYIFRFKPFVLLSYPIGLSLLQSVFYVETRHRITTEPFLLFFAILFVVFFLKKTNVISQMKNSLS